MQTEVISHLMMENDLHSVHGEKDGKPEELREQDTRIPKKMQ